MKNYAQIFSIEVGALRKLFEDELLLPPWLFRKQELMTALESAKRIDIDDLINKLNYLHFMGESLFINLKHPRYADGILLKAYPEPCLGAKVSCRWQDGDLSGLRLENYSFECLILSDGQSIIFVPSALKELNSAGITVELKERAYEIGKRQVRRYPCREIEAELFQSGFLARGALIDFSPLGFRIKVRPEAPSSFNWFNPDAKVTVNLYNQGRLAFSGICSVIRQTGEHLERDVVVSPLSDEISRFRKKLIRNSRHKLNPTPTIQFEHPFFKRLIQRTVDNISISGFAVQEPASEGVLMPGMIIPELTINYAGVLKMRCTAQVIFRRQESKNVICGMAILDMSISDFSSLSQILSNVQDSHSFVSHELDMDALWEFLFQSGFIYPQKYKQFEAYREDFKAIYRKLYQEKPEIARHFTYEKDGQIYAHVAMIRSHERAWLVHHHAARPLEGKRTGFHVFKQIINYLNGLHHLPSAMMDYVMFFYRPENRFPDIIFGDFTRELNNPRACSMDLFGYLLFPAQAQGKTFPKGWELKESSPLEMWEIDLFYKHKSGGLFVDAVGLRAKDATQDLKKAYEEIGLMRSWRVFSLLRNGNLKAVFIVDRSDLGLNLSELLNSIKVLVINPEELSWDILETSVNRFTESYRMESIPVLVYPHDFLDSYGVPYERRYYLWILDLKYGNDYLQYIHKRFGVSF